MIPIVAGAITAAKSSVVAQIGEGLGSLFGAETATDRERAAKAQQLLNAALAGDRDALTQLVTAAFVADRPKAVKDLSKKALQQYYRATGEQPPAQYAAALNVPIVQQTPIGQAITQPVLQAVGTAAVDVAEQRAKQRAAEYLPWIVGAGLIVLGVMYVTSRRK